MPATEPYNISKHYTINPTKNLNVSHYHLYIPSQYSGHDAIAVRDRKTGKVNTLAAYTPIYHEGVWS